MDNVEVTTIINEVLSLSYNSGLERKVSVRSAQSRSNFWHKWGIEPSLGGLLRIEKYCIEIFYHPCTYFYLPRLLIYLTWSHDSPWNGNSIRLVCYWSLGVISMMISTTHAARFSLTLISIAMRSACRKQDLFFEIILSIGHQRWALMRTDLFFFRL